MSGTLDIDSLARGDSHMIARFLDTWNAARVERGTWPTPFDDDYDTREVDVHRHGAATLMLGVLAGTWVRHLLRQVGVKDGDTPPPTSSQQRTLIRLLNAELESGDDGRQVLGYWANLLLSGQHDRLRDEFDWLAGNMDLTVLGSIVNHVRRTSPQFNGQDLVLKEVPHVCQLCGTTLTPPRAVDSYGPNASASTDCGGDCLACMRQAESEMADD